MSSSRVPDGRVPIPRAKAKPQSNIPRRVTRACEPCRARRIKCDGIKPTCSQCSKNHLSCAYSDRKNVKDRKQLQYLNRKVVEYQNLLQKLSGAVDDETAREIQEILEDPTFPRSEPSENADASDSSSSSIDSEAVDAVTEDLNRDEAARATGFFGKPSQVAWMQRLALETQDRHSREIAGPSRQGLDRPRRDSKDSMASVSYHLDDMDIGTPMGLDLFALPKKEVADEYLRAYLETVQPSFPIIRSTVFKQQYQRFFQPLCPPPGNKWLAVLNMIFAIGAKYRQLISGSALGEDDTVYFNRARALSLNGDTVLAHSDLQQIQVDGLISFYLMAVGQVNRAWKVASIAIRSSVALGINLRIIDTNIHEASKEARVRVWWSLYALENLLVVVTGRSSFMDESVCSVPQPAPFEEERFGDGEVLQLLMDDSFRLSHMQGTLLEKKRYTRSTIQWLKSIEPNNSLYFFCLIDLVRISQATLKHIYSPKIFARQWSEIERQITLYNAKLDLWLSRVPNAFQFNTINPPLRSQPNFLRQRAGLALHYYSARITVCRPCMTSLTKQHSTPRTQTSQFQDKTALMCVRAALELIEILPEDPDTAWLFWAIPWWSALHYIMQASIIFLLYLTAKFSQHSAKKSGNGELNMSSVGNAVKKSVRWLHDLAKTGVAARRAYEFLDSFVRHIAPKVGLNMTDVPSVQSLTPVAVAFPDEHHLHPPWLANVEQDSVLSFNQPSRTSDRSSTSPGQNMFSPLSDEYNTQPLPGKGSASDAFSAPTQTDGSSAANYDIAAMNAGLSVYDNFSQEYMYSLFPAANGVNDTSHPAWQFGADGTDEAME